MKSLIILIIYLLQSIGAPTEPIVYRFPVSVQSYIQTWVDSFDESGKEKLFFYLGSNHDGKNGGQTFYLHFCAERSSGEWGKMVNQSNRWVRVGSKLYPILLDYDEIYGVSCAQDLNELGTIGQRDGVVMRTRTLFHGYTVFFDHKGKHVKCSPRMRRSLFSRGKSTENKAEYVLPRDTSSIIHILLDKEEMEVAAIAEEYKLIYIHRDKDEVVVEPVFEDDYLRFLDKTHSCVLVDTELVPLLFDYDLLFSIKNPF